MPADTTCLVIGDLILDHQRYVAYERPSPENPRCPVGKQEQTEWVLGGAGNVARWVAGLGDCRRTGLIAHYAESDAHADVLTGCLRDADVAQCAHLKRKYGRGTVKERIYLQRGLTRADWEQVIRIDSDTDLELSQVEAAEFGTSVGMLLACQRPAIVVIADYGKGVFTGEHAPQLLLALEEKIKQFQVPVIVNSKYPDRWRHFPADVLVCNEGEYEAIEDHKLATRHLVVTCAERGVSAFVCEDAGWARFQMHAPTLATDVCDVTGAGDAFLAGLASHLVRENYPRDEVMTSTELHAAIQAGQACAAACVGQLGCGTPGRLALEETR